MTERFITNGGTAAIGTAGSPSGACSPLPIRTAWREAETATSTASLRDSMTGPCITTLVRGEPLERVGEPIRRGLDLQPLVRSVGEQRPRLFCSGNRQEPLSSAMGRDAVVEVGGPSGSPYVRAHVRAVGAQTVSTAPLGAPTTHCIISGGMERNEVGCGRAWGVLGVQLVVRVIGGNRLDCFTQGPDKERVSQVVDWDAVVGMGDVGGLPGCITVP